MGLDTEMHVTWDAGCHEAPEELMDAIRAIRVGLLAEHAGTAGDEAQLVLGEMEGLVARLDQLAADRSSRLRFHPSPTPDEMKALAIVDPQELPFDAAAPEESDADEEGDEKALFRAGMGEIWELLTERPT
jgi:hypothetical protein